MQRDRVIRENIEISKALKLQISKLQKAPMPYAVLNQRNQSVFFSRNCQVGNSNKSTNPILNTSRAKKEATHKSLPSFSKPYVLLGEQQ